MTLGGNMIKVKNTFASEEQLLEQNRQRFQFSLIKFALQLFSR